MGKRSWFKHYANASQGASLRTLFDNADYEAYAFYWIFLECLCRFEDESKPGSMTISWGVLCRETGWKLSKCRRVLARISSVSQIDMNEKPDGNVTFLVPKWLELQTSWGGKREARFVQEVGRSEKLEVRSESKEKELKPVPTKQSSLKGDDASQLNPGGIQVLIGEWQRTLDFYKIQIDAKKDDHTLYRLGKQYGVENLILALRGFKYEPSDERFDARKNCALYRLQDPGKFERLRNIGATERPPTERKGARDAILKGE